MKQLTFALVLCALAGCSKPPAEATGGAAQTPLTQKLQAMSPSERTEYAKTHLNELAASAGASQTTPK